MSVHAANPAGFCHLSRCVAEQASASRSTRNGGSEGRPCYGVLGGSKAAAMAADSRGQDADGNFALARVCRRRSRLCSGTASGLFLRPAALALLLRVVTPASQHRACRGPRSPRPFGVTVPPKTSLLTTATSAEQTSFGSLPESRASALGAWPTRLRVPRPRSGNLTNGDTSCTRTK